MKNAVELNVLGLKCDAPGCDYRTDDVLLNDYDSHLNQPCPKCGANLLTAADLAAVKLLAAVTGYANVIFGQVPDDAASEAIRVGMNGTGDIILP